MANVQEESGRTDAASVRLLKHFAADESGATAIEYGMIATLIAVACIASFTALGGNSSQGWQGVANKASAVMK